jgi:hypothetical protein
MERCRGSALDLTRGLSRGDASACLLVGHIDVVSKRWLVNSIYTTSVTEAFAIKHFPPKSFPARNRFQHQSFRLWHQMIWSNINAFCKNHQRTISDKTPT